jgi:hypothetical protein
MTMRVQAGLLMLAVLLSPLTSAVCEFKCSPAAASPRLNAQPSCHEAAQDRRGTLRSQPHRCGSAHPDAITAVTTTGTTFQPVALLGPPLGVVALACVRSPGSVLTRPPGSRSDVSPVTFPPLRI